MSENRPNFLTALGAALAAALASCRGAAAPNDTKNVPMQGVVVRADNKVEGVFYPYPRGVVTGSIAVSCEHDGQIYFAVCKRKSTAMTMAGTSMLFDLPDGSQNPGGQADANLLATALRSLKGLFGMTPDQYPALLEAKLLTDVRSGYSAEARLDMSKPQRGFGGDPNVPQIGVDYSAHIGQVKELPALTGKEVADFDTQPTWVNVAHIKKVKEGDITTYRYVAGDNPNIPQGSEMFPGKGNGGMDKIEALVAHARDLPYREAGFDGVAGFMKLEVSKKDRMLMETLARQFGDEAGILDETYKPETQTGPEIAEFYNTIASKFQVFQAIQRVR